MTQPTLINLHPNKYIQGLQYHPFAINLDRCMESCNTLNYVSNRVCVQSKTKNLNLSVFNLITGINKSKTLTKHISCGFKCNFNGKRYNSNQEWNNHNAV